MTIGLLLALAATRLMHVVLVGISPADPLRFVATILILVLAALLGCIVPALRAMGVDLMVALRFE